jgi:hypothetical protein
MDVIDGTTLNSEEIRSKLEIGELIFFKKCPFPLPSSDDLDFLLAQKVYEAKSVSYFADSDLVHGYRGNTIEDQVRIRNVLSQFSSRATSWLAQTLPNYYSQMRFGPLRFRIEEEKGRKNVEPQYSGSVLHLDMNGDSPTHGESFLRIFVNINPAKSRYWVTSDSLGQLLDKWGDDIRIPNERMQGFFDDIRLFMNRLLRRKAPADSAYHRIMSRIHYYGKTNDYLQNKAPQHLWVFPPGSAWLVFSDITSHAVKEGQFAIDQTYFVPSTAFKNPRRSTKSMIKRFWARKANNEFD